MNAAAREREHWRGCLSGYGFKVWSLLYDKPKRGREAVRLARVDAMARKLRCSESTIKRATRELRQHGIGIVSPRKEYDRYTGRWRTVGCNGYVLHSPALTAPKGRPTSKRPPQPHRRSSRRQVNAGPVSLRTSETRGGEATPTPADQPLPPAEQASRARALIEQLRASRQRPFFGAAPVAGTEIGRAHV